MSPKVFQMKWPDPSFLNKQVTVLSAVINHARAYEDGAQLLVADSPLGPQTEEEDARRLQQYRLTLQRFLDDMTATCETFTVTAHSVLGGFIRLDITQKDLDEETKG